MYMVIKMNNLLKEQWFVRLTGSIITIIVSIIIYNIISRLILKGSENSKSKLSSNKRVKTYAKLIRNIIRYTITLIAILIILQINGVNITSMVAGVGVLSLIIGFAIQDALKDIIKGFDIISDSYYQVGDIIKFENITGKVLSIGLKTTKLEDVYTLNIVSIANRKVEQVEIVSSLINIDIPLPYELSINEAESAINIIVNEIKKHDGIDSCEYKGVNDLSDSSIKYQIKVNCNPVNKLQLRRDVLGIIMKSLQKQGINVPYNQIDIHNK